MVTWCQLFAPVFPASCPGCGARAEGVCARCRAALAPPTEAPPPPGVDWWAAPFAYQGAVRRLIVGAKYRHSRAGLGWLAEEMAVACGSGSLPDVVTWVPAHPARRRRRGFDQGRVLATGVAAGLGLPVRGLLRRPGGDPQTGSGRSVRAAGPRLVATARLAGRTVLVVDDVATTGASLAAAAAALRAAGAHRVAAVTAARTERTMCRGETDLRPSPH